MMLNNHAQCVKAADRLLPARAPHIYKPIIYYALLSSKTTLSYWTSCPVRLPPSKIVWSVFLPTVVKGD